MILKYYYQVSKCWCYGLLTLQHKASIFYALEVRMMTWNVQKNTNTKIQKPPCSLNGSWVIIKGPSIVFCCCCCFFFFLLFREILHSIPFFKLIFWKQCLLLLISVLEGLSLMTSLCRVVVKEVAIKTLLLMQFSQKIAVNKSSAN